MSDPGVSDADEWVGGADSTLAEVGDLTLEDLRNKDLPALASAMKILIADLDNPVRYIGRESQQSPR